MPAFFSPIVNPASWSLSHEIMEIPAGFRYGGYKVRALRCTIGSSANVMAPFQSVLKKHSSGTNHFIEIQMLPFLEPEIARSLTGGIPTCYLSFTDDDNFSTINDNHHCNGDEVIRSADSVSIAMVFQDRVVRDPHYWTQLMSDALGSASISNTDWEPFRSAVETAFSGNNSPVVLLDAQGSIMDTAEVDVVYTVSGAEQTHRLTMTEADHGDLQETVSRMGLSIPDLWTTADTFVIRAGVPAEERAEWQFSSLEDKATGVGEIAVTKANRHLQMTHLIDWFADQFVTGTSLSQYTRGNKIQTFINGKEFFKDFFRELHTANSAGNGLHHVGYLIIHDKELTEILDGDPADLKIKLKDAMQRISDGDGKIRLLPAQFIHLKPGAPIDDVTSIVVLVVFLALSGLLILYDLDVELFGIAFELIDAAGLAVVLALMISSFFVPLLLPKFLIDDDGLVSFEKNKDVRDFTEGLANGRAIIAPFPSNVDDNPDAQSNWLIDFGMNFIDQFGIYHQKFSVIKNTSGHIAYCGGIDLNSNRLDDEHHMAANPYHDTHLRIEGHAVADVAQTFHERWIHEDEAPEATPDVAFPVPATALLGTPGKQIVQFGRTYFKPSDASRELPFATDGDRTILNTIIKAITQAKEYIYIEDQYFTPPEEYKTALLNKVANREIKKLVIVVPDIADQPFGDIEKQGFIQELAEAQNPSIPGEDPASIVHIGYPRRNYHLPENKRRASSGKCILKADLPKHPSSMIEEEVVLGTGPRLPGVPFYMAIEGEILYAYKVKGASPGDSFQDTVDRLTTRTFYVLRGEDLPDMDSERKAHKTGAAVSILEYKSIYVHSKTMIIDDIFLCQGSANINQRGHYHDGEANIFCMPENLKNGEDNPIQDLRIKLWADMLNIPRDMAGGLLRDPIAAAELFGRTPQQGNRMVNLVGREPMMLLGPTAGTSTLPMILTSIAAIAASTDLTYDKFYKTIVDPASGLKP